ncbi:MAG: hypothetical protein IKM04_03815 [Clostridia bacterium]|nr:hypothetical protein [Clostridia bacterium]
MKKLALVLAVIMLFGVFASCGSGGGEKGGTTVEELIASYRPDLTAYGFEKGVSDSWIPSDGHPAGILGGAEYSSVTSSVGAVTETVEVVSFPSKGARLELLLDLSSPVHPEGQPYMLEITEMHSGAYGGWGYLVSVNGTSVYFRTYEELASGRVGYFITVPEELIDDPSAVNILIVSRGGDRFNIAEIRGYSDFYGLAKEENIYSKLDINLFCNRDTEKAAAFAERFSGYESFEASALYAFDYFDWDSSSSLEQIVKAYQNTPNTNGRAQFMLKSYWTFVDGADGLGGFFSDLKYQQVLWNAATGGLSHTTPNQWSNTHWLSYAVDHTRRASVNKLSEILSEVSDLAALAAASGPNPRFTFIMDHSIDRYIGGDNVFYGGDFHPDMIAKAAAKGVTLDPRDGMSYEEKEVLYTLLAEYNTALADAYRSALGYNAVTVRQGEVTLPTHQMSEDIWSHGTQSHWQWPNFDRRVTGWMGGIGENFWPSSEDMWFDDQRIYEYKLGYGRIGCVNLEMAIHGSAEALQSFVSAAYANGMEYVTMFNDSEQYNSDRNLRDIDSVGSWIWTPEHYERVVYDIDYKRDYRPDLLTSPDMRIVGVNYENCRLGEAGGELFAEGGSASVVYTLDADDIPSEGLRLYIEAKATEQGLVEIYGGESLLALEKLGEMSNTEKSNWFNDSEALSIDLSEKTKGAERYYIKIVLSGQDPSSDEHCVSLRTLRLTGLWKQHTGSLVGAEETYYQKRVQNLYIAARRYAERLLKNYTELSGSDAVSAAAEELIALGRYGDAKSLLLGELSQTLPAAYAVDGYGRLGRYPVEVKTEGVAVVRLEKLGSEELVFRLVSEETKTVELTFEGLKAGKKYILSELGQNRYAVILSKDGQTAEDGKLTLTVSVRGINEPEPAIADTVLEGRMYMDYGGGQLLLTVQQPELSHYNRFITLYTASDCEFVRGLDGTQERSEGTPRANDMVIVTVGHDGLATRVEAVYGDVVGKIVAFEPPSYEGEVTNGRVTLDNGVTYELEYRSDTTYIDMNYPWGKSRELTDEAIAAAFRVGSTIRIEYCPYTYNGSLPRMLRVSNP